MRGCVSCWLLLSLAGGCANQLALNAPLARNTIPPPTTQNRAPGGGSGYYNPLSLFQPSNNSSSTGGFAAPFANLGAGTSAPNALVNTPSSESSSPFWNLPSATNLPSANALGSRSTDARPSLPFVSDRWASRTNGGTSSGAQIPPRSDDNRNFDAGNSPGNFSSNTGFPNSSSGDGFGNSGFNNNPSFSNTANNNPLGNLFGGVLNSLGLGNNRGGPRFDPFGTQPNVNQLPTTSNAPRPLNAPPPQTPRFDFGSPRSGDGGESPIRISDSAQRDLPRNPRGTSAQLPAASKTPANPLPTTSPPAQDSDYIEISRLPAGRSGT